MNNKQETNRYRPTPAWVVHRAPWVIVDSRTVLRDGYLAVKNGRVAEVGQGRGPVAEQTQFHDDGVLMPALVNAHTHLELTALKGMVSWENSFRAWVRELLSVRGDFNDEELTRGAGEGIDQLINHGTAVIGEVSTSGLTQGPFWNSRLSGIWFQEYLGETLSVTLPRKTAGGVKASVAGHAPHTASPDLLTTLKQTAGDGQLPFSIHLAESEDETEFITTGSGAWADFLTERGIDYRLWPVGARSPVCYADDLGLLDHRTLAVHLIAVDKRDINVLVKRGVNVCCCPRSNLNLHRRLPPLEEMMRVGLSICLGTDSLASVGSLDVLADMAVVEKTTAGVSPADIFDMGTVNGAKALGFDADFGTLAPGKSGPVLHLSLTATSSEQVLETIVHNEVGDDRALIW